MSREKDSRPLQPGEYVALAEFRYQLRRFLRHMEEQCRKLGVNPQQYQLVLAVKGLPRNQAPTIGTLAERLQLNHNSMVELVDRCERSALLRRERSPGDRRLVRLAITTEGEVVLRKLGSAARSQLRGARPALVEAVLRLTRSAAAEQTRARRTTVRKAGM